LHEVNVFLRVASDLDVKGLHSSENSNDAQEQSATEESIGDEKVEQVPDVAKILLDVSSLKMNNDDDGMVSSQSSDNVDKGNIHCEFPHCKYVAAQKRYLREHS
jgi:hypothetical protein